MNKLTVLFDADCLFCRRCRAWLAKQRAYLELEFLPAASPQVEERFPGLARTADTGELVVISDEGGVYRGPAAFIMCLYALTDYRELSLWLARRPVLPLARQMFRAVSASRGTISRFLGRRRAEDALREVSSVRVV